MAKPKFNSDGTEKVRLESARQRGMGAAEIKKQVEPLKAKVVDLRAKIKEFEDKAAALREEYSQAAEKIYMLIDIAPFTFKNVEYQAWQTRGGFHIREVEDRGTF